MKKRGITRFTKGWLKPVQIQLAVSPCLLPPQVVLLSGSGVVQGIDLAKNEFSKKWKISFKLLEVAYFSVAVLLIAGTNGKVGKQSTKNSWVIQHPAICLESAVVIPCLLLNRDFLRVVDRVSFWMMVKQQKSMGKQWNVFFLASIDEFCRNVAEVLWRVKCERCSARKDQSRNSQPRDANSDILFYFGSAETVLTHFSNLPSKRGVNGKVAAQTAVR